VKSWLINVAYVAAAIVVLCGVGYSIEWFRRRAVQKWAESEGGTFAAGTILGGTPVAEGAAFDTKLNVTYNNVSRFKRPEASYVVGQYHAIWDDIHHRQQSTTCVVAFIEIPNNGFPPVRIDFHSGMRDIVTSVVPAVVPGAWVPVPIPLPDATPAFAERWDVLPLSDGGPVKPESLAPFLPKAVQDELVASGELISQITVRGNIIKIQAVGRIATHPHKEVFEIAKRLGALWTAKR
jgi:hypothetical protein